MVFLDEGFMGASRIQSVWRKDFPILGRHVHGHPLAYLDSAATSQKPKSVIDRLTEYYETENANVHRGIHHLSDLATTAYEGARQTVADFMHAESNREIVFVRGTTEGINLVAQSFLRPRVQAGDEIILTRMEHHSNIVPWRILADEYDLVIRVMDIDENGELMLDQLPGLLNKRTKMLALTHVSNVIGTINPIKEIIKIAKQAGVPVLIDGAQATPHLHINVTDLDCDFYVFSGHKAYAPTGIGALYGKYKHLAQMPPYHGGGSMISQVSFDKISYLEPPAKFEAGTPSIADAIGLATALTYINSIGLDNISTHENKLLAYANERLATVPGIQTYGPKTHKAAIIAFNFTKVHAHDVATILDQSGVAIRAGHHCAMPLIAHYGITAVARASFAMYNDQTDIDAWIDALFKVNTVFGL